MFLSKWTQITLKRQDFGIWIQQNFSSRKAFFTGAIAGAIAGAIFGAQLQHIS